MRTANVARKTGETDISLALDIDGRGERSISTGIGFFDHMLDLIAAHAQFDLNLKCLGDTHVDAHHSVEDIGIAFGQAIKEALGGKVGIKRYSSVFLPMDEALAHVALDISGRAYLHYEAPINAGAMVGDMDAQLFEEFFRAVAFNAGITLHINVNYGKNIHHILEAICKGFARAMREAVAIDSKVTGVPSTKGVL